MISKPSFRYRIEYAKTSAIRFTSHLDMLRAWERTFRRAELPIAYTQGFNPRPRLNMGAALPLGCTSECELIDIWLTEENESEILLEKIRSSLPPNLAVQKIMQIDEHTPKLQQIIQAAEYYVFLDPFPPRDDLEKRMIELLESNEVLRERKGKTYNLRALIHSLEILSENNQNILSIELATQEGSTGRPDEVLLQLNLDPLKAQVHRKQIFLTDTPTTHIETT